MKLVYLPINGICLRIGEALKENSVGKILKAYNGDGGNKLQTWDTARHYGLNLYNLECHYFGEKPKIVYHGTSKPSSLDQMLRNTRVELNSKRLGKNDHIIKDIPPTIEFRLTPYTDNKERLQHYLLLFNTILGMARSLDDNEELKERVQTRNKTIDSNGPNIFNVDCDNDGIRDLISWLPKDKSYLGKLLLEDYKSSKPLNLKQEEVDSPSLGEK